MAGAALPSPILVNRLFASKSQAMHCFGAWSEAIGAYRKNYLFQQPEILQQPVGETNAYLEKHGFSPVDKGLYFNTSGDLCFYPLLTRKHPAGLQDLLVPVFQRKSDGSWEAITTLTRYQIEALAHVASNLKPETESLHEWLLPVGAVQQGHTFRTRKGILRIETRAAAGGTTTFVQISDGRNTRFESRFSSRLG